MATPVKTPEPRTSHDDVPDDSALADLTREDAATTTQLPSDAKTNSAGVPSYLGLTGSKLINAITATSTIGFLLFGYDQGVMSGLITGDEFVQTFPGKLCWGVVACGTRADFRLFAACDAAIQGSSKASLLQATYTAIYEVGCLFGAVFALFYGNKTGRRRMMQMGSFIMIIGVTIQITAIKGHWAGGQFIVGRVVTVSLLPCLFTDRSTVLNLSTTQGVGNGMNTSTIPSWMAECSRSHNRGLLICIEASMIATGTAIAYWIDFGLSFVHSSFNWRFPIAFQILFAIGLMTGVHFLPESPRWLMHEGRHIDAQRVIAALSGDTYGSEATVVQTRLIMQSIEQSHQLGVVKKRNMFTNGPTQHFRRMLCGASSQIFQQIGGCNSVIYFCPVIFEEYLNQSRQLSLILGGVNVTVYALAAFGSYFTIERLGRRKMFLIGSVGQCLSMVITFACLIPGTAEAANGAVLGLFLFLFFFGSTWLELPWLYPAEINPLRTRTNANAVSTISNWLFNFAVVEFTPPFLNSTSWGTFLFAGHPHSDFRLLQFAVWNALFIPIIYFFYPETMGRTLEEIDLIFAKGYAEGRSYVDISKSMPKLTDEEVRSELDRLHREHQRRKGAAEAPGSDQNTLSEVEAEITAETKAYRAKAADMRHSEKAPAVPRHLQ
ncbi:SPOSA6832_04782 [Sporobolomyces salmonicolor]|uniref:SPOSA6832_04782-mRNA-1:cds n=1 Tax=Sporidiobolus salmonicolor TaxID=5005 RepID=A0A0D6ESU2_SPOSA|nr:SPOSA6832_04782 [Sporobolomyces salmonicolor]